MRSPLPSAADAILHPPFCPRSSRGKGWGWGSASAHGSLRASVAKLTPRKKKRLDLILLARFCLHPAETVTGLCGEDGRPPDSCGVELMTSVRHWPRQITRRHSAICTGAERGEAAHRDISWGFCSTVSAAESPASGVAEPPLPARRTERPCRAGLRLSVCR